MSWRYEFKLSWQFTGRRRCPLLQHELGCWTHFLLMYIRHNILNVTGGVCLQFTWYLHCLSWLCARFFVLFFFEKHFVPKLLCISGTYATIEVPYVLCTLTGLAIVRFTSWCRWDDKGESQRYIFFLLLFLVNKVYLLLCLCVIITCIY